MAANPDGTIVDDDGRIVYFSVERFVRDIAQGDCCFLCGVSPNGARFNNEHVVPQWLLKKFDLYRRTVTLPNGTPMTYGRYTVPCCEACNTFLGRHVEEPMSRLFAGGFASVSAHLAAGGGWDIFRWLSLLFFKTHLKDASLQWDLDARKGTGPIGDNYEWAELHHIHCVVRQAYTQIPFTPALQGSLQVLAVPVSDDEELFDYCDLYEQRGVLFRCNDVAVIAVLNDAGGVLSALQDWLGTLAFPLESMVEIRELFTHFSYVNDLLTTRPRFFTRTDLGAGMSVMMAEHPPQVDLKTAVPADFGGLLHRCIDDYLAHDARPEMARIRDEVKKGLRSFLRRRKTTDEDAPKGDLSNDRDAPKDDSSSDHDTSKDDASGPNTPA
jgi:hypothetical protein